MLFAYLLLALQLSTRVDANAEETQYSCGIENSEMDIKVRKAATDVHNKWRNYLAAGKNRIAPDFSRRYPTAADMLAMTYNCSLEDKARQQDLCRKIFPRSSFTDTDKNYDYVIAESYITREGAMIIAGHNWWDRYLSSRRIEEVTPEEQDYATLPFFIMGKASTPTVGCAVQLCSNTNAKNFYAVYCYYEEPYVKAGEPLYKAGQPCSECPEGYKCKDDKMLCRKEVSQ